MKKKIHSCRKIQYGTKGEADRAKKRINDKKEEKGDRRILVSRYRCPDCHYWHLSSMTYARAVCIMRATEVRENKINPDSKTIARRLMFLQRKKR